MSKKVKEITVDELACVYAALILVDDDVTITADKMTTILNAAGLTVESIWPSMFARALSGVNLREIIANVGSMVIEGSEQQRSGGTGAASGTAEAKQEEEKKEEPKQEAEEDSDEDFGFGLFD